MSAAERVKYAPAFLKIQALLANGLTGVDLTRCWVSLRIMPLSRRDKLLCEYSGEVDDPMRCNRTPLTDKDLNSIVKSLLGEPQAACNQTRLQLFYVGNPAPEVENL